MTFDRTKLVNKKHLDKQLCCLREDSLATYLAATPVSDDFTAGFEDWYLVDVSSSAVTVSLDVSNLKIGDYFKITDIAANSSSNNITIDLVSAGQDSYGASANIVIDTDGETSTIFYTGPDFGWIKI